jgi:hypothetical protein
MDMLLNVVTSSRLLTAVATLAASASLGAQAPTMAAAQTTVRACTYATCSIRLENGGWSGPRIRTGLDGEARRVGFTGTGIVDAVHEVPAALTEAQLGHTTQMHGRIVGLVTTSAAFAWMLIAAQSSNDATRLTSIYGGVSLGLIGGVVSAAQMAKADQHFSRAVWIYNSALPQ